MKGTPAARRKKNAVALDGPWLPLPLDFIRSRAFCELSPQAAKMLFDLCSLLGPNAKGNGDISAAPSIMKPKGWKGGATRDAALRELETAGLIVAMRQGSRRSCTLFAVTLWPLQCDMSKLDHGPGAFTTLDWRGSSSERSARPTLEAPAKWNVVRKNAKSYPAAGQAVEALTPPRDKPSNASRPFDPAVGSNKPAKSPELVPPRDTFLDLPSGAAVGLDACAAVAGTSAAVGAVSIASAAPAPGNIATEEAAPVNVGTDKPACAFAMSLSPRATGNAARYRHWRDSMSAKVVRGPWMRSRRSTAGGAA